LLAQNASVRAGYFMVNAHFLGDYSADFTGLFAQIRHFIQSKAVLFSRIVSELV
jgi:hypothetical protein